MKTQIFFQTKPSGDYSIIATPYNVTVEWSKEKTEVFAKYGDDQMLKMWCEQVLKLQFPNYDCIITNISAKGC